MDGLRDGPFLFGYIQNQVNLYKTCRMPSIRKLFFIQIYLARIASEETRSVFELGSDLIYKNKNPTVLKGSGVSFAYLLICLFAYFIML